MTITDRALVLERAPWKESDKRVVFFTQHHGKVEAVAIGAHKIKSKLSGHLEPLRLVDMMIAEGKQVHKVAQALTVESFVKYPVDITRVTRMGEVVRLVDRATETGARDEELFGLLYAALSEIADTSSQQLDVVSGAHLFSIAEHLGYAPEFAQCVVCGRATDLVKFSAVQGGVVCATCRVEGPTISYANEPEKLHTYMRLFLKWRSLL